MIKNPPEVVDLFCGVGALSHGLKLAGLKILAGYDLDGGCKYAFEKNNNAKFYCRDVNKVLAAEISRHYSNKAPSVLAGCAPCQPFSTYKQRYEEDPQWSLVEKFADIAVRISPDYITMENVPSLEKYKNGIIFNKFCKKIIDNGYYLNWTIAHCEYFGVPQRRKRLVVIASKLNPILELKPKNNVYQTVRDVISGLPELNAGGSDISDPLHAAASLSDLNIRRIRASKPGGTWRDWPEELVAECHKRKTGKTYPGVYARMSWDEPAPTMTTQCFGYGNGRFGHPQQDRAISLREAALFQSFPPDYQFIPKGTKPCFKQIGRWIGNAVPVKLGQSIGDLIINNHEGEIHGETL